MVMVIQQQQHKNKTMGLKFVEEGHVYESTDDEKINWLSVTSFIAKFKPKLDKMQEKIVARKLQEQQLKKKRYQNQ